MTVISLDLERRFERRWAARFAAPVASAAPQVAQSQNIETMPQPPLPTTANDNRLAWPFIPFPEGWYGA
jgi:hypothetical protein